MVLRERRTQGDHTVKDLIFVKIMVVAVLLLGLLLYSYDKSAPISAYPSAGNDECWGCY